jgi:hypothetical protein
MKSYYTHLKSTMEFGEENVITRKPILRSSGVFPVIQNKEYSSKINFLGYWLLKRNIPEVTLIITLRDQIGKILLREIKIINQAKAFTINLKNLLKKIKYTSDFIGSIETEFNTTRDMVFPYPALVLEYYNEKFNTCVHTLGRIYNDFEDLNENETFRVPETGFDIHETDDLYSFLSFVNGPKKNENGHIEYVITNSKSEKYNGSFSLGKINPFETKLVFFKDQISDLRDILDKQQGSISLKHNFEGFYPRFLVGNIQKSFPSVSFTHSYYDCTSCNTELDFWNRSDEKHYDSSVYVPIFNQDSQFTNLMIYPNFSPSDFSIKIDIHKKNGDKVYEENNFLQIKHENAKLLKINFNKILNENNLNENNYSAHITTNFKENKIPTRIKFGLDIGIKGLESKLPCNICFNTRMGNPLIENKPGSFHWSPIFKNRNTNITLGNFSTIKNYKKDANIEMNFYRIEDSLNITKKLSIKANSEERFIINEHDDLKEFFYDEGWVTIKADNPYIEGYYFNIHKSGSVSGDHFF